MIWARKGLPARKIGSSGKGGVSILLFINGAAEIYHVHGNIGHSNHIRVREEFNHSIEHVDDNLGVESGFLLVIDNTTFHHKALRWMINDWGYYPPASTEQAALLNNQVSVQELYTQGYNSTSSRAQFYRIRKETRSNIDNARFVIMTPPGVAPFQPCEFLFATMKDPLAMLPDISDTTTTLIHVKRVALQRLLLSTGKHVVKGCLRAAVHFR